MSMMRTGKAFELGGVIVPWVAGLGISHVYRVIGGFSTRRLLSGAAFKQSHWEKLEVVISASGISPLGLTGLDYNQSMTLKCGEPRNIRSQSNVIAITTKRRTDAGYSPRAYAYFANSQSVETALTITSHTATLVAVTGAIGYAVEYYPELIVVCNPPEETFDQQTGSVSWSLTAEEL
jgi:hypothetical protein